jgi:hypothetical protein
MSQGRALFGRQKLDDEFDGQLRTHIDLATGEHLKLDRSTEEARKAALHQFGGLTQIREALIASAASLLPTLLLGAH